MRLGISLPIINAQARVLDVQAVMMRARWVEDAGLDSIWMGDTFGPGVTRPDPLMWLLAAAAATKQIELGTAVLQLPLRNPAELSQRLMTLTGLTNGRFSLGVGAGSRRSHAALGADYDQRFHKMREYIDVIRRLCSGEWVGDAHISPWPEAAKPPPVLIGTWGSATWLRRAAQDYDGWIASAAQGFTTLSEGIKRFREAGGKRALVASLLIDLEAPEQAASDDGPFDLVCPPRLAAERLQSLAELGFDDALVIKTDHRHQGDLFGTDTRSNLYGTDFTLADLTAYRSLLPIKT